MHALAVLIEVVPPRARRFERLKQFELDAPDVEGGQLGARVGRLTVIGRFGLVVQLP